MKNIVEMDSYDMAIAYKFSILTIFGFFISIFFNPILGHPAQDTVFYLNAAAASLCILFIFNEAWVPRSIKWILSYNWILILLFCLPFLQSYTMVRSEFYFLWINNFLLASIILYLVTAKHKIFFKTWILGSFIGILIAGFLNYYAPSTPKPPYPPFDYDYAIYTTIYLVLVIMLLLYNKFYAQKRLLLAVEEEVADRTKKLQESLSIKKDFLDNVSHEIKTPIHNITNIVSVLHEEWDNLTESKKKELIQTLMNCNQRILNLCTNILDISKFRKGESVLSFKEVDMIKLIDEIIHEYQHVEAPISMEKSTKLRNMVQCDSDRIFQVLRNLLDNAIKYGKNSPIIISAVNYGNNSIKVTVSDNGPGIPEEELGRIFEPFEQSTRTKTKAGGTGLGLSICKQIIEMHNGSIWVKNNNSGGTSMYFIIPNKHK